MLSNPPYGKSWKTDLERMGGKRDLRDRRFLIEHDDDPEYSLVTRSSDGQMLFLANMLSKMKQDTELGSRIAEVHNGSSLFTGDAGQGESNIRRWIIENDWLEAIVALPLNMFYNTGIATYIWVLSNRKGERRRGKVQLIDATEWYQAAAKEPRQQELRACRRGHPAYLRRLPRLRGHRTVEDFSQRGLRVPKGHGGAAPATGRNRPRAGIQGQGDQDIAGGGRALRDRRRPSSRRVHKTGRRARRRCADSSRPPSTAKEAVVEYEPDTDLRDTEQVPLLEEGGVGGLPPPRGAALCAGRVVCAIQRQDRLRDQLHTLLLQAAAAPFAGGHPHRHPRPGARD